MNHSELVRTLAERTELDQRRVQAVLAALGDVVGEQLAAGEKVSVNGLFIAERGERAARTGRHPRTGEPMVIAAASTVKLKPAAALKRAL